MESYLFAFLPEVAFFPRRQASILKKKTYSLFAHRASVLKALKLWCLF